jgi:hypothetical protein
MNKRKKKLAWGLFTALLVFVAVAIVTPKDFVWIPSIFVVLTFFLLFDHLGSSMRFFPKGTFKPSDHLKK